MPNRGMPLDTFCCPAFPTMTHLSMFWHFSWHPVFSTATRLSTVKHGACAASSVVTFISDALRIWQVGRGQQNGQKQRGGRAVGGTADSRQEWLDDLSSKNVSRKTGEGQGSGGKSPSKADALFSWFCKTSPPKSPSNERNL